MHFSRKSRIMFTATALAVAILALASAYHPWAGAAAPTTVPIAAAPQVQAALPDFTTLVADNSKAVVSVKASLTKAPDQADEAQPALPFPEDSPFGEFFKRFQMPRPETPVRGLGSGFIISPDGYILTNNHVVDHASEVVVKLSDRRELRASIVGTDRLSDVALLKVDAEGLPTVRLGDSDRLQVGQWVLAIGAPFGFDYTATQGIVSALGRSLPSENYVPFIQTDVPVNPGNSGGPLFDTSGRVVGINSQIYSRTGGYMGVSFAIPIKVAMEVVGQLKQHGHVERGYLGVSLQGVDHNLARSFGLDKPRGALVAQVMKDGPAARAGIREGDIIVEFAGTPVLESSDLPPLVGAAKPGTREKMTVFREGREKRLEVAIAALPGDRQIKLGMDEQSEGHGRLNLAVSEPSPAQRQALDLPRGGVVVEAVGPGAARDAGIEPGDVLLRLNNREIADAADLQRMIGDLPAGKPVALLVRRGQDTLYLALDVPDDRHG